MPDSCCSGADIEALNTVDIFTTTDQCYPLEVQTDDGPITVYLAGGCDPEGTFFYGEQCGGSQFGPFDHLSDGTELGLGVCDQPDQLCNCNAYVSTQEAGCYNVGTPPGAERYFMRVNEAVCTEPVGNVLSLDCHSKPSSYRICSK